VKITLEQELPYKMKRQEEFWIKTSTLNEEIRKFSNEL